jgi:hypothetical protein
MVTLIWVKAPIMQLAPDADTFEQLRPQFPDLPMPDLDGATDGIAERLEVVEIDLRLG